MNKRVKTRVKTSEASDEYDFLTCPKCGENYLHQHSVTEYFRRGEDGPTTAMELCGLTTRIPSENAEDRNPSSRRDGIRVSFFCECCSEPDSEGNRNFVKPDIELVLAQHKGFTEIWMEHTTDEYDDGL